MPMKTKEEQNKYQKEWMRKRRQTWIDSQGGVCAKCGSDEKLEVDHIDRKLKTMPASNIWSRSESVRELELENCQVLCTTCHQAKSSSEREWSHGLTGYDNKKCRCEVCYEAKRDHNAKRYKPQ